MGKTRPVTERLMDYRDRRYGDSQFKISIPQDPFRAMGVGPTAVGTYVIQQRGGQAQYTDVAGVRIVSGMFGAPTISMDLTAPQAHKLVDDILQALATSRQQLGEE